MAKELTGKQELFCIEYMVDLNATQACIRAGYSEHTAKDIGCQNLAKLNIQERIQELMKRRSDKTGITAEKVINEIAKIAFSNMQDFTDNSNGVVNINNLDQDKTACISSIETSKMVIGEGEGSVTFTKVKLYDKLSALDKLAKHLGMYERDNSQKQLLIAPQIIMGNAGKT